MAARWCIAAVIVLMGCESGPSERLLYSDEEVLRKEDAVLAAVPSGTTAPRDQVFNSLGIEAHRLGRPWYCGIIGARYLGWQISPSFDIVCMTGLEEGLSESTKQEAYFRSDRPVYGLTIHKHMKLPDSEAAAPPPRRAVVVELPDESPNVRTAPSAPAELVPIAPPPHVVEERGAPPTANHVWAEGYWFWTGEKHRWIKGLWVPRPSSHTDWVAGHWEAHGNGYVWVGGFWK